MHTLIPTHNTGPKFNLIALALFVLLVFITVALFSCKEKPLTDKERQAYQYTIDSVLITNLALDAELKELKSRKPIHDTVYKTINKKVKNEFKKVDNFDSLARVNWINEFERANTPNE